MRYRGVGVYDGVEVQAPVRPPGAIVRVGGERSERERFESAVKKSGRALWAFLTSDSEDGLGKLCDAADELTREDDG